MIKHAFALIACTLISAVVCGVIGELLAEVAERETEGEGYNIDAVLGSPST